MVTSATAVYVALTHLASREASSSFVAAKALIGHLAGVTIPTAAKVLVGLQQHGLLRIESRRGEGKLKQPNRYTLLSIENHFASIENGRGRSVSEKSEKRIDESKKRGNEAPQAALVVEADWKFPSAVGDFPIPESVRCAEGSYDQRLEAARNFWPEVQAFARANKIPRPTAEAWFRLAALHEWTIRGRPIRNWHNALFAFAQCSSRTPRPDPMTNEQFWVEVDRLGISHDVVHEWIEYNKRNGWKRTNKLTGAVEPMFDYIVSLQRYDELTGCRA